MCTNDESAFHLQFGKATSGSVTFDTAFDAGITPIVFLMPTIDTNDTNNDGPASVFPVTISETGFTWVQEVPISRDGRFVESRAMPEVHWLAVTPAPVNAPHVLSDGTKLVANTITTNKAVISGTNNTSYYDAVALDSAFDVLLHQKQSQTFAANNCWLTSTSEFYGSGFRLSSEAAEVRMDNSCQGQNQTSPLTGQETIGYLAIDSSSGSGTGSFVLDNNEIYYQFGKNIRTVGNNVPPLSTQCAFESDLTGFTDVPTFVAGKNTRRGGDGGWLRRCTLTKDKVSVVNDEDTYGDSDRAHTYEQYSFVALEDRGPVQPPPVLSCFNDDFSQGSLTSDWLVGKSGGSFTPEINNGRLRQTEAVNGQSTVATYQRLIPGESNYVTIEFDHFAYAGDGADGMAVVLSDASITPVTGAFGGPLGYGFKPGIPGFTGGWLGIGIDEYGNFSAEGGSSNIGRRRQSLSIRGSGSGQSGYNYLRGTCANGTTNTGGDCLSPTVDNNNNIGGAVHRYRITVDSRVVGQSIVEVKRRTDLTNGFVSAIAPFDVLGESGQATVPTDFILSLTGSTGGDNNIHEVDNFQFCALESTPVVAVVDHFEFSHDGNGLTCNPETITIKACADSACTQLVTDQVTVNLSPVTPTGQEGWSGTGVVGDQLTFTGGTASVNLSSTSPGAVTLGVSDTTPSATLCVINSSTASAANCALTYAESGFIFGSSASPTSGIADEFANKPVNSIIVSAVQTDATSNQCIAKFMGETQSLGFWQSYSSPNTGTKSITVTSGGISINAGADLANKVPLALSFDNQGQATIAVNYADAGEVSLHANYTGSAATLDDGLVMNGNDSFVRYPRALCVLPETTCAAGDVNCPAFKRAGENFTVEIEPKAWQSDTDTDFCNNISTPNYAHNNIELSVNLVAPSGGVNADDIANYNHIVPNPVTTSGINTVTRAISEVGVFSITATPPTSYLGVNNNLISSGTSQPIGRFYPNDFAVSAASIDDSCGAGSGAFTYMDQPVPLAMTITARNTSGATTNNYFGGFASGGAILVAENNNDGGNSSYQSRFEPAISLSWDQADQGVQVVNQNLVFKRQLGSAVPNVINTLDGPFALMQVGLIMDDDDNVTVDSADMNAGFTSDCSTLNNCDAKQLDVKNYRYGRINLANTFGAETTELLMPVTTQYWNDTINDWVVNTDDNSCSSFTNGTLPSSGVNFSPALTGSQSVTRATNSTNFVLGKAELQWNALSASPLRYRGEVNAPLAVEPWLQWFWNGSTLSDPRASASFGTFRGQDRIISWREVN